MTRIVCLILLVFAVPVNPGFAGDTPCPPPGTAPTRSWSASDDFSSVQGQNQWSYDSVTMGQSTPMAWNSEKNRWEGSEEFLYIHEDEQHPGGNSNSARTWTAPASGQVQVEGVCLRMVDRLP
jgi:hypothetical protein